MDQPRPDQRPDSVSPGAPPPSPWWSRPGDDPWSGPEVSTGTTAEQPSPDQSGPDQSGPGQSTADAAQYGGYVQPTPGAPPYGAYAEPATTVNAQDPWSRPTTRATFPSGAQAWGYPTDTIGAPLAPARPTRRGGLAAAILATALIAGGAGGAIGARTQNGQDLLDASASLGSASSTSPVVDRAPDSIPGIAARVMKSTVSIAVRSNRGSGTGSGVVIRSDGYILTNNHVVESAADGGQITVTFDGAKQELPAQIVGRDPVTDLAVIQVKTGQPLPAATLGRSRSLVVGDPVIAIGSPLGLSGTVTTGIVSALNRTPEVPGADGSQSFLLNAIQTDAAINPGNSGGALVNAAGEVVGINSAIATLGGGGGAGGGSIGIGFAIPIDEARSVAEEIIRTGQATHPSIGVSAQNASPNADRKGAVVRLLSPSGGAARAGLQESDLIVKVNNTDISTVDELITAIRSNRIDDTVTLTYVRGGQTRTAEVVLQDLQR